MNCDKIREQLPVLLDHRLATADATQIRAHLEGCPDCRHELTTLSQTLSALDAMPAPTPSPRLRARVYAAIAAEQHASAVVPPTVTAPPQPVVRYRWSWLVQSVAAIALIALGFAFGARTAAVSPAARNATDSTQQELATLRAKVDSMSQLVGYSLLQQQSRTSNERLHSVLTSAIVENPDSKIINDLIGTLAFDPSTNVRLNALEALYLHADQDVVRAGVLTSLPREQSPLVQVSMIDFLVATRDREAAATLQKLSDNAQADDNVRAAAKRALNQL